MAKIECIYVSLLTVSASGRYLRYKTVKKYATRAKEAELVFTFVIATLEEKATTSSVLKILTSQSTTRF